MRGRLIRSFFIVFVITGGLFIWLVVKPVFAGGEIQITNTEYDVLTDMIADGEGGVIIGWTHGLTSAKYNTLTEEEKKEEEEKGGGYVQKINKDGGIVWSVGGIKSNHAWNWNYKMVSDGDGGVILIDEDFSQDYFYFQKIGKDGKLKWGNKGIAISRKESNYPDIFLEGVISDNSGGVLLFLSKTSDLSSGNFDSFVQRIDSNGNLKYGSKGKKISLGNGTGYVQFNRIIAPGGNTFMFIGHDSESYFWQKLDFNFNTKGIVYLSSYFSDLHEGSWLNIFPDNLGGALISYKNEFIKIDKNGIVKTGLKSKSLTSEEIIYTYGTAGKNGNIILVWYTDWRGDKQADLFAQKIDQNGNILWTDGGMPISTLDNIDEMEPEILYSSFDDSVIIGWQYDPVENGYQNVAVQKVNADGSLQWTDSAEKGGILLGTSQKVKLDFRLIYDKKGGIFIAFESKGDKGIGSYPLMVSRANIYALRLNDNGKIVESKEKMIYLSTSMKGKKNNFKKGKMNFKIIKLPATKSKLPAKKSFYWMKVMRMSKNIPSFTPLSLRHYWRIKTNLDQLANGKSRIQFTFVYGSKDLKKSGLKEKDLVLYYYSDKTKTWKKLSGAKQNKKKNTFSALFSYFDFSIGYFVIGEK